MPDLLAARLQMAVSLAFHIVFAVVGIAMPVMMVVAEWRWRRTGLTVFRDLAHRWARGTAILFAVGAVSGTVLSFELGLLWPTFMRHAGPLIGMPFSLEGFAFFTEAIFLGIYLYGWERVSPRMHLFSGAVVALSGALSGIFVVIVNAWMNAPAGFRVVDGEFTDIDPLAAMANGAVFSQTLHMTIAAYLATGFAVAGVHAYYLARRPDSEFHRRALRIALVLGGIAAILQPISGHHSAQDVAERQPIKLASMEGQFETEAGAPLRLGGLPDVETQTTRFAVEIPGGLSFLAFDDFKATVRGLNDFPRGHWPPVAIVHFAFQIMVGLGFWMMAVAVYAFFVWFRRGAPPESRWFLRVLTFTAPAGMIALQAGWIVTEVGRQPWIIYEVMRTADSLTPMPGLTYSLAAVCALYLFLAFVVVRLMLNEFRASGDAEGGR